MVFCGKIKLFIDKFLKGTIGRRTYPTIDTRGVAPMADKDEGTLGIWARNLGIGAVQGIDTVSKIVENALCPDNMTPTGTLLYRQV